MVMGLGSRAASSAARGAAGTSPSGAPGGMQSGQNAKATLKNLDDDSAQPFEVHFNPTSYSISKSNSWTPKWTPGKNLPSMQFTTGGAMTLTMELLFDTYEAKGADSKAVDVREVYINKIMELTRVSEDLKNAETETSRPPRVMFTWGEVFNFPSVITSLSVNYTLFAPGGVPVRARVNLSLMECQDEDEKPSPQNPTSQGTMGQKVYTVKHGDTLDRIAYAEYKDPAAWRHLADVNRLNNPLNLKAGQILEIRPLNE